MNSAERLHLCKSLLPATRNAGAAIMSIYDGNPISNEKADGSPVTEADLAAEAILVAALRENATDITVVSEENADSHRLAAPNTFFLIDPLDGTKEFLKRDGRGEFTVNIALIENGVPSMGILFAPALDQLFWGVVGEGAWENGAPIRCRAVPADGPTVLSSVSHRDDDVDKWLDENPARAVVGVGSSLKFALIAKGDADAYPRFGPTMEWDTAAGHSVLSAAGGSVCSPDGSPYTYGKPHYRSTAFIARGLPLTNTV